MDSAKCGNFAVIAALSSALLGACERPEAHARNSGAVVARQPANELPRDVAAAALAPAPPVLAPLPSREAISDTVITGRIKAAILTDPGMTGADVSVNTDHGVVILAGSVKSYEQAGLASAHSQSQDGVMRVDNQLTLAAQ